ncbi:efflux RND transporter permease subunit [candidate division KSB1 bacterium]|nr:efflux RND transporter permease subunit [candidate division KSB1 bacterium]RQW02398.1 MAG: efflux RND transporter permease subunit [candidate division KSB1 bacterium]
MEVHMNESRLNPSLLDRLVRFCLENKIVVFTLLIALIFCGYLVAPFDWHIFTELRNPVPVDAIPDIGENQQIVFTEWPGRSPQDVEDQISYPLTVALLGIPDVKSIRSFSMMGFSTIYIIFKEHVEFYWSRSRILEKLNSLPPGTLPDGVKSNLGPDATALGQVFWYTLEGRDSDNNPTGGWDLHELRSIQDYHVRYALMSAEGIAEVASVGGFVQEYQIDVDPNAMRSYNVTLEHIIKAVQMSNIDVGARTIEMNNTEYVIRGIGFVKSLADIENTAVTSINNSPVLIKNIAHVGLGPALRRGILDKEGAEVVGGVAVVRYGENPLAAIKNVKEKIAEISPGLPKKRLADGTVSQVTIVPFYDRTNLIYETLGTLESALVQQILITIIVVILLVKLLKISLLISGLLPIAVLMSFIAMKFFSIDANIVALSGIAIAIGTMVDMGIVITENIVKHVESAKKDDNVLDIIYRATSEVSGAVITAVGTTVISFIPVFSLQAAEGKLFRPLAFTKTFALIAAVIVALTIIPPIAHLVLTGTIKNLKTQRILYVALAIAGVAVMIKINMIVGIIIALLAIFGALKTVEQIKRKIEQPVQIRAFAFTLTLPSLARIANIIVILGVAVSLAHTWHPLGAGRNFISNFLFVIILTGGFFAFFYLLISAYPRLLRWALEHKRVFLTIPGFTVFFGLLIWLGFDTLFGWLPRTVKTFRPVSVLAHAFPGLGKEFMPSLDEGSFLFMPTTMPHASIGEVHDVLRTQDMAINALPEIESVVGKLGRAETPLDPAPLSMIETVIHYKSEFFSNKHGRLPRYVFDADSIDLAKDVQGNPLLAPDGLAYKVKGIHLRGVNGELVLAKNGRPFRNWRPALDPDLNPGRAAWPGINSPNDIWDEIIRVSKIPGTTSAPKLQPIETRIVMLQSGMRAPMGIKVKGPDLPTIEKVALDVEQFLKEVPSIHSATVQADRVVGKPYLEIHIDREKIARYGIHVADVQNVIEVAIGGKPLSRTVEGRERYAIRVRYMRELRNSIEDIKNILVAAPSGVQIPLGQLATIKYVRGPQMIKSEDTYLTAYVIFDKKPEYSQVEVIQQAEDYLQYKIQSGDLDIPAGVSFYFAGSYENQLRAQKRLAVILPTSLFVIFMLLYLKFKNVTTTALIFSSIAVAWSGGFVLIWLYGQSWFFNVDLFGIDVRQLFNIHPINLSVAIWVGFLALFGIASDDGVLIATYLDQSFARHQPRSISEIRQATLEAGRKRVRPMVMTTATTLLALLPVLTSSGRGSDIMIPMAIPAFGGMLFAIITMFVVPVLYAAVAEFKSGKTMRQSDVSVS